MYEYKKTPNKSNRQRYSSQRSSNKRTTTSQSKQAQERIRRQKLRQKKLKQRRIRRNRFIAAVFLGIVIYAMISIFKLITYVPTWSKDLGDNPSPADNHSDIGNGDNNNNNDGNSGNKNDNENIYDEDNIDVIHITINNISIKPVDDYKKGINEFKTITLSKKDLHKGDIVLINDDNPLPDDFSPNKLINIWENRKPGVIGLKDTSMMLEKIAFSTIIKMFEDMKNDNAGNSVIVSSYRTIEYQQKLLDEEVGKYIKQGDDAQQAMSKALEFVAKPGRSEHNYGYAIDISAEGDESHLLTGDFELTPQGKWLKENSWKYGYIVRYPKDKISITKIGYEPWHLRYIGYPHSAVLKKLNLCLEEYIDYLKNNKAYDIYLNDDNAYRVYYVDAKSAVKNGSDKDPSYVINVPGDNFSSGSDRKWTISGDGANGFIVTVKLK